MRIILDNGKEITGTKKELLASLSHLDDSGVDREEETVIKVSSFLRNFSGRITAGTLVKKALGGKVGVSTLLRICKLSGISHEVIRADGNKRFYVFTGEKIDKELIERVAGVVGAVRTRKVRSDKGMKHNYTKRSVKP